MNKAAQIVNKKVLKTIIKDGRPVTLSVTTEADSFKRPTEVADRMEDDFGDTVVHHKDPLPKGTAELVLRSAPHTSKDPKDHSSVVALSDKGIHLSTIHMYPPPKDSKK